MRMAQASDTLTPIPLMQIVTGFNASVNIFRVTVGVLLTKTACTYPGQCRI